MSNSLLKHFFKPFNYLQSQITLLNGSRYSNDSIRTYAAPPKRFYKSTGILKSNSNFEVTLDQRKLKTPKGTVFSVESEPLALAVATEWNSQKNNIIQSKMHITTLCNTVIDNPNNLNKFDIVTYIANYLDTDTILFQANEDEDLVAFQEAQWDPVIEWFNKRFDVNLKKSQHMDMPPVSENDKSVVSKYLSSYNFAAINGFVYAVDTLKSVVLTLACVERFLTPEKTVLLSRLEEEFQAGKWGRVEWAHDLSQQDLQARLSAAVLFIYFNSQSNKLQQKSVNI